MTHNGQSGVVFDSGGYSLFGTLYLAKGDLPKPTAVVLHGVPGIEKNVDIALHLRENGWNALIFHYRGSWGSAGTWDFSTLPIDAIAAVDHLTRQPQVDNGSLVMLGHSAGGYAAILAAAADARVKAVVVYGTVADPRALRFSLEEIRAEFTPWLPGLTPEAFADQWAALSAAFAPVEQVARLHPRPLLIIHGEPDEVIPVAQAHMLAERAGPNTELRIHPVANHAFTWHRGWLRSQIFTWLLDLV
ncbi:MAG: alpha/beta hydrolase [Anaerolineae bacterium]